MSFLQKLKDFPLKLSVIAMALPATLLAKDTETTDVGVLSQPLKVIRKLLIEGFGLLYIVIALAWVWLPALAITAVHKYYANKEEQGGGGQDYSGDKNKKMLIAGFGSLLAAFVVIGLAGNLFFTTDEATQTFDLATGIKNFYGDFAKNVRNQFIGE